MKYIVRQTITWEVDATSKDKAKSKVRNNEAETVINDNIEVISKIKGGLKDE